MKNIHLEREDEYGRLLSRFPGGIYTTLITFFDKKDENILKIDLKLEHVTVDRENF